MVVGTTTVLFWPLGFWEDKMGDSQESSSFEFHCTSLLQISVRRLNLRSHILDEFDRQLSFLVSQGGITIMSRAFCMQ